MFISVSADRSALGPTTINDVASSATRNINTHTHRPFICYYLPETWPEVRNSKHIRNKLTHTHNLLSQTWTVIWTATRNTNYLGITPHPQFITVPTSKKFQPQTVEETKRDRNSPGNWPPIQKLYLACIKRNDLVEK